MMRRAWLFGLALSSAAFPAACSSDDGGGDGDGSGGGGIDLGTGGQGQGGEQSTGDGDEAGPTCESFSGLIECNSAGLTATPVQVNILLVLDSSGSMRSQLPDDPNASLWDATKAALTEALDTAQSSISFGLDLFPNAGPQQLAQLCEMPDEEELTVPIAPGPENRDAILGAIGSKGPGGGTPTAAALRRAFEYFTTGDGKDLSGRRFVLLATDGGPNCNDELSCDIDTCTANIDADPDDPNEQCAGDERNCCENYAVGCLDDAGTEDAIEALGGVGVDTFVVGLPGSELYEEQLNKFALAGGRPSGHAEESYYKVDSEGTASGLAGVLKDITRKLVTSCEVELEEEPGNESLLNVAVDCEVIPWAADVQGMGGMGGNASPSTVDSWFYDRRANSAIIQGPICEKIKTQGVDRIDIIEGCPTLR